MKHGTIAKTLALAAAAAAIGTAYSNHSWGGYHWARTSNPFIVDLGDNLSSTWKTYLNTASSDWSQSTVLNSPVVPGAANPKNCRPTAGRVEVCNSTYGNNGWLGVAQIWASGSHITQGTVKLNDTYFRTGTYNTPAWRQLVTCQEIGHTYGLDHQDENFNNANLGTCMDYTNDPSSNQHPNKHDYDELVTIYSHLDSTNTTGGAAAAAAALMPRAMVGRDFDRHSSWGQLKRRSRDGASETYVRDFGNGHQLVTHVLWAQQEGGPADRQRTANEE